MIAVVFSTVNNNNSTVQIEIQSLNLSVPPGRRGPSKLYKLMLGPQRRLGHTSDGRLYLFCSQQCKTAQICSLSVWGHEGVAGGQKKKQNARSSNSPFKHAYAEIEIIPYR